MLAMDTAQGGTFWREIVPSLDGKDLFVCAWFVNKDGLDRISFETVENAASQRLMENVHPAGFAAGRNREE